MVRRASLIATSAAVAALAIVASAVARPEKVAAASALSCKKAVSIGMLAPITGQAGSIGSDQLHWAQFYVTQGNKNKKHVQIKLGQSLTGKGAKVDRESISQKATDFSSLVAKVTSSTKIVYLPFQLASQAQLFAQQLKAQGKSAVVFGSDGTFDSSKFNVNGSYISFFAPDVTTIKAAAS